MADIIVLLAAPPWDEEAPAEDPDGTQGWARWPCPAGRRSGGAGGQAITACGICGAVMATSAGTPHTGFAWAPVVAHGEVWWHDPNRGFAPTPTTTPTNKEMP